MSRARSPGVEDIRYTNPITGVASSESRYIDEQGIKQSIPTHKIEYKFKGEWIKPNLLPSNRDSTRKSLNSKRGYFCSKLAGINKKGIKARKQGKFIQGENEFRDSRWGRCDKLMAHYDNQVERYGEKCPMTHIPFTREVALEKFDINNLAHGIYSNISADRIFNHIDYTEQNTIFTSQLWNLKKGESSLYELKFIFLPEIIERYKAIVEERFPDQKYTR